MTDTETKRLITLAQEARATAYAPYSHVAVGAALLCKSGKVYTGANIENAAFSPGVCAERVAFMRAVHDGEREFTAIAVMGGEEGKSETVEFPPCGVCRQTMAEFCGKDFEIILSDGESITSLTLGELLPHSFGKDFL